MTNDTMGTRPASPVDRLGAWRNDSIETLALALNKRKVPLPADTAELVETGARLEDALLALQEAVAELSDINAEWVGAERGRWYRWGLAEVDAERRAMGVYRTLLQTAKSRIRDELVNRNRAADEVAAHKAEQARAAARAQPAPEDVELNRSRRALLATVFELVDAPAEEWGPETRLGLQLRAATKAYEERKNALRSQHPAA